MSHQLAHLGLDIWALAWAHGILAKALQAPLEPFLILLGPLGVQLWHYRSKTLVINVEGDN